MFTFELYSHRILFKFISCRGIAILEFLVDTQKRKVCSDDHPLLTIHALHLIKFVDSEYFSA